MVSGSVRGRTARVHVLQVPGCPLVDRLRQLLDECSAAAGVRLDVEVLVGDYPSPTLVVGGLDVATGAPPGQGAYCRLDLPTRTQVLEALVG